MFRETPPTRSPVHFLQTICGEEEALDFGMTGFEGAAQSVGGGRRRLISVFSAARVVWVRANVLD